MLDGVEVYRAASYQPGHVRSRYARSLGTGFYRVFEVNDRNRTIRELDVRGADLPPQIVAAADLVRELQASSVKFEMPA